MIYINRSKDEQFYFTVESDNGKVLATSETYTRKRNCFKGAQALIDLIRESEPEKVYMVDRTANAQGERI